MGRSLEQRIQDRQARIVREIREKGITKARGVIIVPTSLGGPVHTQTPRDIKN